MGQLTVRNLDDEVVDALKQRAKRHGRSAEAEHRLILRESLLGEGRAAGGDADTFFEAAARLRKRLKTSSPASEVIREMRDSRHPG